MDVWQGPATADPKSVPLVHGVFKTHPTELKMINLLFCLEILLLNNLSWLQTHSVA